MFDDNVDSKFPTIISVWNKEGWLKSELIEDTVLNQVTLKLNMVNNDVHVLGQSDQESDQDGDKEIWNAIIEFCSNPKSAVEIMNEFNLERSYFRRHFLDKMLAHDILKRTEPDNPKSRKQTFHEVTPKYNIQNITHFGYRLDLPVTLFGLNNV